MRRVELSPQSPGSVTAEVLSAAPTGIDGALALAGRLRTQDPYVGSGCALDVWEALATLGAHDLALARAVEPDLDAITILSQAGFATPRGSWGVFAAEGPGVRLRATETSGSWTLSGVKPWCSLAGRLSNALVTAWVDDSERRLFAVDLRAEGVEAAEGWAALGLREIPSGEVSFADVPAHPVGTAGWYLRRPGFAWGGISVAACWFGGATGVARPLLAAARDESRVDDQLLLMHLGAVEARLTEARIALAAAAVAIDGGHAEGRAGDLLAKRVRSTVARTVEDVLRHVGHALGPSPLVRDAAHAKRVADLELYVRQHHAERDDASLGRSVRDSGLEW